MGALSSMRRLGRGALVLLAAIASVEVTACTDSREPESKGPATPATGPAPVAPPAAPVEDVLTPVRTDGDLPALGALVIRDGAVVAEGVVGVRRTGGASAVTMNDAWSLGTDAQAMTATLAALVVESGKLTWASTLGAVLPDVPMHASYKSVPLDALLGHRGGAPSEIPASVEQGMRAPGTPQERRDAAVRSLLAEPPEVDPQTAYLASDAGYLMAAVMLERATGQSWEDLMRARLLEPLGMTHCEYGASPSNPATDPWGHRAIDGSVVPIAPGSADEPAPAMGPAGAMRCPLRDWGKFCALHLAGARRGTTTLLGKSSFEKLQTPTEDIHALGWSSVSRSWAGSAPALNQSSRPGIAHALVWIVPEKNTAFLVVTNRGDDRGLRGSEAAMGELVHRFIPNQ